MKNTRILLDLDGTILDRKHKIDYELVELLKDIKKYNDIMLVTGRSVSDAYKYYKELELNNYMICYNGAYIYNPLSHEEIFSKEMSGSNNILKYILNKYIEYIDNIVISSKCNTYLLNTNDKKLCEIMIEKELPYMNVKVEELYNIQPKHRMIFSTKNIDVKVIIDDIINSFDNIDIYSWINQGNIVDVSIKDTDKWEAVKMVLNQGSTLRDKIIALGDARNDISMIKNADIGIAMKNASNEVKKYANIVTEFDNNHKGAYWILKSLY